jgi:hypothetical protein
MKEKEINKESTILSIAIVATCLFFGLWQSNIFAGLFLASLFYLIIHTATLFANPSQE